MSHVEISKRLVMINSTSAVLSKVIQLVFLFWMLGFLARNVSESELTVYFLVQTLMFVLPLLAMAVGGGLTRFVTEAYARGQTERVTQIVSTLAPMCLGTAALVLLVGYGMAFNIEQILDLEPEFHDDARLMFAILVTNLAVRVATMPFQIGLQVKQKFIWMHIAWFIATLLQIGIAVGLLLGVSPRALWVIVATVPQTVVETILICVLSCRVMPSLRWRFGEFRRELVRPLLAFGGWTTLARIAAVAREAGTTLILNKFPATQPLSLREGAVFTYRFGNTVETRVWPFALAPLSTTLPALTAMYATGQPDRLRHAFFRITRLVMWAFVLPAVPLIIYRHEFWLVFYGREAYAEHGDTTATVMMLLLLKALVVFPQPVIAQLVAAMDKTKPMALRVTFLEGLTVVATLYAVAVHNVGAVGAAAVTIIITLIGHPLLHWALGLRLIGATWADWVNNTLRPGIIPGAVTLVWCLVMHALLPSDRWYTLGPHLFAAVAVYFVVLVRFCLAPNERSDLAAILARARALLPGKS